MERSSHLRWALLCSLAALGHAQQNIQVPWSSKSYGPDGPWQAVSVRVGGINNTTNPTSQSTAVDLFPGGRFSSYILEPLVCSKWPNSACSAGGVWSPSSDSVSSQIALPGSLKQNGIIYTGRNFRQLTEIQNGGTTTVYSTALAGITAGNITYPNGVVGPPVLGILNVGWSKTVNLTFTLGGNTNSGSIQSSTLSGGLWEQGFTPSNTMGMHIGSAAFKYPGSLTFGGYDTGRIIGQVVTWSLSTNAVSDNNVQAGPRLLDVTIGVETGGSPFSNFTKQTNLLLNEASTQGSYDSAGVEVQVTGIDPYLRLSPQTCAKIASYLPVALDSSNGYYLWQTNDPAYTRIVQSPAYLGFVFAQGGGNVTIKVPFALLNLTLTSPVVSSTTQYFPCVPYKLNTDPDANDNYSLGRAFLQAAYLGANWNRAIGWLGQAPGPGSGRQGLGTGPTDLQDSDTALNNVNSDTSLYASTWSTYLRALPANDTRGSGSSTDDSGDSSGLSTGAKAGIGVGVAVGALALIGLIVFLLIRRSRRSRELHQAQMKEREAANGAAAGMGPYAAGGASGGNTYVPASSPQYGGGYSHHQTPTHVPGSDIAYAKMAPGAEHYGPPSELAGPSQPSELPTPAPAPVELPHDHMRYRDEDLYASGKRRDWEKA